MDRDEVREKVIEIVKLRVDFPDQVKEDNKFHDDLGESSLDVIEQALEIESLYGIHFSYKDIKKAKSVKQLIDVTMDKIKEKCSP